MSSKETLEQFGACWEGLEDPRCGNAALHDFHELLMIALCCVLCGGQGAVDMAVFAEAKEPFLRSFLTLANGLPSHDTFSRLFRNLDPDQFRDCFQRFMAQFFRAVTGCGGHRRKVLRRSFDRASGKSALHMVSAWARSSGWCWRRSPPMPSPMRLRRCPTAPAAGPQGTIVTADALNCQRAIAEQIVAQKGDYALALKGNQGTLLTMWSCCSTMRS